MPTFNSKSRIRWLPAAIIIALNHFSNYTALERRRTTATMAGSSDSIGLNAFVPVDTAVAALFLTAAVESSTHCVWRDCADYLSFDHPVSGERI